MRSNKNTFKEKSPDKKEKPITVKYRSQKRKSDKSDIYKINNEIGNSIIKIDKFTVIQLHYWNIDYEQNGKIDKLIECKNKVQRRKIIL